MPALVDNLSLVYNKKLFDAAGVAYPTDDWTWDDFRDGREEADRPGQEAATAGPTSTTAARTPSGASSRCCGRPAATCSTADNTKPAFDSPAGPKAAQLLHDMAVTDKSVYLDKGNGNYLNLFNSGKIAMLWTGPWDLSSINPDVDYGVELLPGDTATTRPSPGPTSTCCSTTASSGATRAWTFLTWLTSTDQAH